MIRYLNIFKYYSKTISNSNIKNNFKIFENININKIDDNQYYSNISLKLNHLFNSLNDLKQYDDNIMGVNISNSNQEIELVFTVNKNLNYRVLADIDNQILYLLSPVSGNYIYYYNSETNSYLNNKDGHLFEEFLTRELLNYTKGYLDL